MAESHLDHPGEVTWFAGCSPAEVIGPCLHACRHTMTRTLAWGPDYEHYTLTQCDDPDGCDGRCRGWTTEYPHPFTRGPKYRLGAMLEVRAEQDGATT